jgi:hypothetical protein
VRDNEAFLTDSPGVDGGAYDIDWDDTRNTVERNYAHDTQGYCIAVFAAGYVTSESVVRDNLCVDNALSPRLAALQGAVYLHTWNDGVIRDLRVEHNTVFWNPPVATAAAIVDDAGTGGAPVLFTGNRIESSVPLFYSTNAQFAPSANTYGYMGTGDAKFTLGDRRENTLAELQAAGMDHGSKLERIAEPAETVSALRLDASVDFTLDADGLLAPDVRAQLMVLRSLAAQYNFSALAITVHLHTPATGSPEEAVAQANAILDLDAGSILFERDHGVGNVIRLLAADGRSLGEWNGFTNAATLGSAVRWRLGSPRSAAMRSTSLAGQKR